MQEEISYIYAHIGPSKYNYFFTIYLPRISLARTQSLVTVDILVHLYSDIKSRVSLC